MKKILPFMFLLILLQPLAAIDFYGMMRKSPLMTINRSPSGKFQSVTTMAIINAPFDVIWETVIDINSYKSYMPKVLRAEIIDVSEDKREITAKFEIEVPMRNTRYTIKYVLDRANRKIDVIRVAGDLEGSYWQWRFYPSRTHTLVIYTGKTDNFSKFLQSFDDKNQSILIGVNISTNLTTVKSIKDRAEGRVKTLKVEKK